MERLGEWLRVGMAGLALREVLGKITQKRMALPFGVARRLFFNEAGLVSAPMVHAAAYTDHPVRRGL